MGHSKEASKRKESFLNRGSADFPRSLVAVDKRMSCNLVPRISASSWSVNRLNREIGVIF